jgi:hypothetical protein
MEAAEILNRDQKSGADETHLRHVQFRVRWI